jgi:hypothetical protein
MQKWIPPECPHPACLKSPFLYRRRRNDKRPCGAERIPRSCGRRFSTQTFRNNYRHHKPGLKLGIANPLVSKVSQRRIARNTRPPCFRSTTSSRCCATTARASSGATGVAASRPSASRITSGSTLATRMTSGRAPTGTRAPAPPASWALCKDASAWRRRADEINFICADLGHRIPEPMSPEGAQYLFQAFRISSRGYSAPSTALPSAPKQPSASAA